ncbi:hypothetical protein [Arthrobacter sp. B2a2-09]|uniref:hypothetical protein n=1 Tax=Arthrobacter sp. B2a2-09 TaxID=2952822 RepID=UPI0022CDAEB7|nr:hypothetical protein [Arthrobacter sp. B2a2-09]MCZ9884657.1 hypothetical protein [Arthrobacter sp. B2a2-09]
MSSYFYTDDFGDSIRVDEDAFEGDKIAAIKTDAGATVYVKRDAVPALALALMSVSGASFLDPATAQATVSLRSHVEYRASAKRREEAEERAKALQAQRERVEAEKASAEARTLDEEALALLNAFRRATGVTTPLASFDGLDPFVADNWRAAATAARELHRA